MRGASIAHLEFGDELFAVNLGAAQEVLGFIRDLLDCLHDGIDDVRLGQTLSRDASDQRFGVTRNKRVGEQEADGAEAAQMSDQLPAHTIEDF